MGLNYGEKKLRAMNIDPATVAGVVLTSGPAVVAVDKVRAGDHIRSVVYKAEPAEPDSDDTVDLDPA